jgi:putative membrane protein
MTRASLGDTLALVNALLNASSGVILVVARRAIRRGDRARHKRLMLSAVSVSALFLASYLARVALTGTHADPHTGAVHAFYLTVLVSHMLLAMLVVPLVLGALWLGLRGRFATHKKLVRYTFPIWLYVSVTGVVVYVVLYHVPA